MFETIILVMYILVLILLKLTVGLTFLISFVSVVYTYLGGKQNSRNWEELSHFLTPLLLLGILSILILMLIMPA